MMNCTKCDGNGESHSDFACYNPVTTEFSPGMKQCHYCSGRGTFPVLDIAAITAAIFTTRVALFHHAGGARWAWGACEIVFPSPDEDDQPEDEETAREYGHPRAVKGES